MEELIFSDISSKIAVLLSPELQNTLFPLKLIFFLFSLFFFGFLIFFLIKTRWLRYFILWDIGEFFTLKIYGAKRAARYWRRIKKNQPRFSQGDFKRAIILADKILDRILERLVPLFQTKTFEQRLKKLGPITISNIDQLWQAHQTAKKIMADPNYKISLEEGKRILKIYDQVFRELEIV